MKITDRLREHLETTLAAYDNPDWFVICLQGSQNYGLADAESDIDSKLLVLPTLKQLVLNEKAISATYVMDNNEHCDIKDIREYFKIFRKQNINFVEILFTDYYIVNDKYKKYWELLRLNAEKIAHYDEWSALKCMKGMALEKYHALCHEYPSCMFMIEKYGFSPKQLHHMFRLKYFIEKYISGMSYKDCLVNNEDTCSFLLDVKRNNMNMSLEMAKANADNCLSNITFMVDNWCAENEHEQNKFVDDLLNEVLYSVVTDSLKQQLGS